MCSISNRSAGSDRAPLLTVFGGKITTYRKLSEHALASSRRFSRSSAPLDFGRAAARRRHAGSASRWLAAFRRRGLLPHRFGPALWAALRYADRGAADGARGWPISGAVSVAPLRARAALSCSVERMGGDGRDVLARRTKLGLHLDALETTAFGRWMAAEASARRPLHVRRAQ